MKVLKKSKFNQRVTHFALAGLMLLSAVAAAGPFIFNEKASAVSNVVYTDVESAGWVTDRTAPSGGLDFVVFDGQNALELRVDAPRNAPSSFYQFEGLQKTISPSSTIKADLYIDPSWPTNVRAGIWGGGYDSSNAISSYPVIEYNTDSLNHWRIFDSVGTGAWRDIAVASATTGWNTIELAINRTDSTKTDIYVNGVLVGESIGDPTESLKTIFLNNYNFGDDDYAVRWSNIQTGNYNPNPAAPTNLSISKNGSKISNGSYVKASFVNGNVALNFDPVDDAYRYITEVTYPGGSTQVSNIYNNTWLVKNGVISQGQFAAHGDGEYVYKVKTRAANGLESGWSQPVSLVYDTTAPASLVTANTTTLRENTSADPVVLLAGKQTTFQAALTDELSIPYGAYIELFKADYLGNYKEAWVTDNTKAPESVRYGANPKLVYNMSALSGRYGLKIVASDKIGNSVGNSVTKYYFFTVDNTTPTVTINQPAITLINDATPTITGAYNDVDTNDDTTISLSIDGATGVGVTKNADGTWTYTLPTALSEGTHTFIATASDAVDNSSSSGTLSLTIDTTAPDVTITSPLNDAVINKLTPTPIDIQGTVTDANPHHYFVRVERQTGPSAWTTVYSHTTDETYSFANPQTIYSWTPTVDGTYRITLEARDAAGGTSLSGNKDSGSATSVTVVVDTAAPALTIDPLTTTGNTPTITGTVDDTTAAVVITIDGVDYEATNNGDGTWSFTVTTPLADGTHPISVVATDTARNDSDVATADVNVTVDTLTPQAPPTTPTDEETTTTNDNGDTLGTTTTVTPLIVNPAAAAILGATTDTTDETTTNNEGESDVEGATTDDVAAIDTDATDGSILGLAWYWWLLILAAIAAITSWIVAAVRRRNNSEA